MAKPKFWTFDHPILDKLPPFNSEGISVLVERIQKGDIKAKEELLYQLLGYIKTRLGKILYKESRLRHDIDGLISFLIEWLVKLIEQIFCGKYIGNIVNYVSASLRLYCLRYLDTLLSYGPAEHRYISGVAQCNVCLDTIHMPPDANELLESLQSAATTDSEHEFIRLRMEGYKNTEIAQALSITTTDVSRLRKTLMRHFNEAS
jgi:DNA-binding CsgD family transcriptional regulator